MSVKVILLSQHIKTLLGPGVMGFLVSIILLSHAGKTPLKRDKQVQAGCDNNLVFSMPREVTNFLHGTDKEILFRQNPISYLGCLFAWHTWEVRGPYDHHIQ